MAGALTVLGSTCLAPAAHAAGPAAQCDKPENFGADAELRISQTKGRALVEIVKPNTAGRKLEVE